MYSKQKNEDNSPKRYHFHTSTFMSLAGASVGDDWDDFPGTEALFAVEISDGRYYPLPTEG